MQPTVVVQPLFAIAATNAPKPFSSAADHSVLVIRQGSGCAATLEDPAANNANAETMNITARDLRISNSAIETEPASSTPINFFPLRLSVKLACQIKA